IRIIEPGATQNASRLFLADAASGSLSELLVEDKSITAPWFGWSPDGQTLAYLAPARRGINYELWLGNANGSNLQTPFLNEGQQTPVAAAWNPTFNIVAVATVSQETRDGLFLVNATNDNVVFLAEETFSQTPFLDWSRDAYKLAYSTADNALKIINTADRALYIAKNPDASIPVLPPYFVTGWTTNDAQYLWTDDRYQTLQPLQADLDPFEVRLFADGSVLLSFDGQTFTQVNPNTGRMVRQDDIPAGWLVEDYGITETKTLFLNGLQADSMQCYRWDGTEWLALKQVFSGSWTHTRCVVLAGGTHVAMSGTLAPESWERLSENTLFTLYITPIDLSALNKISENYAGFELAPIGFSPQREQAVFQEGQELVIYNLQGQRVRLATLQDLDITSPFVQYTFRWQP
ncbi:MAG: hypothetical protein K8I82_11125, partial [Anaerolineae bacterium]|nr:hypothetical protein [Anaerolineae bacterium]